MLLVVILLLVAIAGVIGSTGSRQIGVGAGPIALIRIEGAIVAGQSSSSIFGGQAIGSEEIVGEIERAMEDDQVKAILLRVNSPGGSAAGSQEIYNAVTRAKKQGLKVVVSMADLAASGGYYVSANADRIYANPATVTGSIGVISMHENLSGLFGKLGVQTETIKSGKLKDMGSPMGPLSDEARQVIKGLVMQIYDQFVTAVAEGRKMKPEAVRRLADGRIYSGQQAKQIGLVDELGGMQEALAGAGKLVGVKGRPGYKEYRAPSLWRRLLAGGAAGAAPGPVAVVRGGMLYDTYAAQLVPGPWRIQPRAEER